MANGLVGELLRRRFSAIQEARAAEWLPRLRAALNRDVRVIDGEFYRVGATGRSPVQAERAIHESSLQEPRIITPKAEGGPDDAFIRAVNALAKAKGL